MNDAAPPEVQALSAILLPVLGMGAGPPPGLAKICRGKWLR